MLKRMPRGYWGCFQCPLQRETEGKRVFSLPSHAQNFLVENYINSPKEAITNQEVIKVSSATFGISYNLHTEHFQNNRSLPNTKTTQV